VLGLGPSTLRSRMPKLAINRPARLRLNPAQAAPPLFHGGEEVVQPAEGGERPRAAAAVSTVRDPRDRRIGD
jgi:hypothetical protein